MSEANGCNNEHNHVGHLCVLMSKGKFEEVKELVVNPRFICFNCGRVADDSQNLCNPMPLKNGK